jgi:hypothetical protein
MGARNQSSPNCRVASRKRRSASTSPGHKRHNSMNNSPDEVATVAGDG